MRLMFQIPYCDKYIYPETDGSYRPTNPLPCETMEDELFLENRYLRSSNLTAVVPTTPQEKSVIRQRRNINNITEKAEKMLRIMAS